MEAHQQRVVQERDDLQEKLTYLQIFICQSHAFDDLGDDEKSRLRNQAEIMDEYSDILSARIAAF